VVQDAQHGGAGDLESLSPLVDASYIAMLVDLANEKFKVNTERTQKFRKNLHDKYFPQQSNNDDWESTDVRRERKRAEGLRRQEELKQEAARSAASEKSSETQDSLDLALIGK
jgi:tRNA wybutosine-synthesizing protein 3